MKQFLSLYFLFVSVALLSVQAGNIGGPVYDETGMGSSVGQMTIKATGIPDEVEYITLYTQIKSKRGVKDLYPYVIRLEDRTGLSIQRKEANKVMKAIKKTPVAEIVFEGFELDHIGNMLDDEAAQRASEVVVGMGLHDYGKRDTPVYYFKRTK